MDFNFEILSSHFSYILSHCGWFLSPILFRVTRNSFPKSSFKFETQILLSKCNLPKLLTLTGFMADCLFLISLNLLGWDILCGAILSDATNPAGFCAPVLQRCQHHASDWWKHERDCNCYAGILYDTSYLCANKQQLEV